MKDICRTCMVKEIEMISIFDQTKSPSISDMIMAISSLELSPNDSLPSQVCITCFKILEMTYYFKEQVIKYNNVLQKQAQRAKLLEFALQQVNQKGEDEEYLADMQNGYVIIVDSDEELPIVNDTYNFDNCPSIKDEPLIAVDDIYDALTECNVKTEVTLTSGADADDENSPKAAVNLHFKATEIKIEEIEIEEHGLQFEENSQTDHILSKNVAKDVEFYSEDQSDQHNSDKYYEETSDDSEGSSHLKKKVSLNTGKLASKRRHKCAVCERVFSKRGNLNTHMRTHNGEKPYQCQHCNRSFTANHNLRRHMRMHTGEDMRTCTVCDKSFTSVNALKEHVRRHTGEKPYKCEHCNLRFVTSSNLDSHVRRHTGEARPKRYKCHVCDGMFLVPSHLKVHMRVHTGEKPFKCQYCNLSFTNTGNLNKHIIVHTGKVTPKPYKCEVCGNGFERSGHLKRHMNKHTGERPFKCLRCNTKYTQKSALYQHMRKKHLEEAD